MSYDIFFWTGLGVGLVVIWLLVRSARASARRLDDRIDEYHAEGPPADPYGELARIFEEEDKTKRHAGRRKGGKA